MRLDLAVEAADGAALGGGAEVDLGGNGIEAGVGVLVLAPRPREPATLFTVALLAEAAAGEVKPGQ